MKDALAAFKKIRESGTTFISRGDHSGTNKKELAFWKQLGINPKGPHYLDFCPSAFSFKSANSGRLPNNWNPILTLLFCATTPPSTLTALKDDNVRLNVPLYKPAFRPLSSR